MDKNITIDESYLKKTADSAKKAIEFIFEAIEEMTNEKEDIFKRYMAHAKIRGVLSATSHCVELTREFISMGHTLNHPFFQTEQFKKCEWAKIPLEDDAFFITEEEKKKNEFADALKDSVMNTIKSYKEHMKKNNE